MFNSLCAIPPETFEPFCKKSSVLISHPVSVCEERVKVPPNAVLERFVGDYVRDSRKVLFHKRLESLFQRFSGNVMVVDYPVSAEVPARRNRTRKERFPVRQRLDPITNFLSRLHLIFSKSPLSREIPVGQGLASRPSSGGLARPSQLPPFRGQSLDAEFHSAEDYYRTVRKASTLTC